jgi:sulfoxide reductase heme-binding subunit YedZ
VAGTRSKKSKPLDWLQPAVLTGSIVPFVVLYWRGANHSLGANPIATTLNQLGLLALIFLVSSLACTPVKIISGHKWPLRLRKTLGLMAFFAVLSHFLVYFVFDQAMMIGVVLDDVLKRPFIAIGFVAFLMLIPLALTSTKNALQRIGPKRWKRLHRLAYLCGVLGVVHFLIRVKKDITEPVIVGVILAFLLTIRVLDHFNRRRGRSRASSKVGQ